MLNKNVREVLIKEINETREMLKAITTKLNKMEKLISDESSYSTEDEELEEMSKSLDSIISTVGEVLGLDTSFVQGLLSKNTSDNIEDEASEEENCEECVHRDYCSQAKQPKQKKSVHEIIYASTLSSDKKIVILKLLSDLEKEKEVLVGQNSSWIMFSPQEMVSVFKELYDNDLFGLAVLTKCKKCGKETECIQTNKELTRPFCEDCHADINVTGIKLFKVEK